MEIRSIEAHRANGFVYGFREKKIDDVWVRDPRSEWVKLDGEPLWFLGSAQEMCAACNSPTTEQRAIEFAQAADGRLGPFYYLAMASHGDDEALKIIMSGMAAELNVRQQTFADLGKLLPASHLHLYVERLANGMIDRTFAKPFLAELFARNLTAVDNPVETSDELIKDPRFIGLSDDKIVSILDEVIANNPEQVEKAKTNPKLQQWFLGQVIKATQGKANPPMVAKLVAEKLG